MRPNRIFRSRRFRRRARFGVGTRLAFLIMTITLLTSLIAGGTTYLAAQEEVTDLLYGRSEDVARVAAISLPVSDLRTAALTPDPFIHPDFLRLRNTLVGIKKACLPHGEISTIGPRPNGGFAYGVTTHDIPFPKRHVTDPSTIEQVSQVYATQLPVHSRIRQGALSSISYASYLPLRNERGIVDAVIVVEQKDLPVSLLTYDRSKLWSSVVLASAVAGLMGWLFSRRFSIPLRMLSSAAEDISRARRTPIPIFRRRDEIGRLSRALRIMYRTLRRQNSEINRVTLGLVAALEQASGESDTDTGLHIRRVAAFSELLARKIGLDELIVKKIERYAPLHDVGKVAVPDHILKKSGRLTDAEYQEIKRHVSVGATILGAAGVDSIAINICKFHHERWDGHGYLEGLKGKAIPVEARIVAIADVYDALTSSRCYKSALSPEKAKSIMMEDAGAHFDPELVETFFAHEIQLREIRRRHNPAEPPATQLELVYLQGQSHV